MWRYPLPRQKQPTVLPIICIADDGLDAADLAPEQARWAKANDFSGQMGKLLALPSNTGEKSGYLFGVGTAKGTPGFVTGLAAAVLPSGAYQLEGNLIDPDAAALGFLLGGYSYNRFKSDKGDVTLEPVKGANMGEVQRLADAAFIARDLINAPANILGPDEFEAEVRTFAKTRKMTVKSIVGDDLIKHNFPLVHAVGRASAGAPRLLDISWGTKSHPKVTLVGKGVTFDTGGLNIKPTNGMVLMKKDMGGAANVLGLAHAIVDAKLKVRLRVIIPVVENAISSNSFRPGDVLPSRSGKSVEIGNTDAEGRLILADALTLADEESPDLIIDMATLTGAARVALGPELVPFYTNDDALAGSVQQAGMVHDDPMWRMPLWGGYDRLLSSSIADVSHISSGPFAGSITAALFLQRFVSKAQSWAHFDIYGWAPEPRAGRSKGGTDQGIRALYKVLKDKYA